MHQPFIPLQPAERDRLDQAREWLKGHFVDDAENKYALMERKLELIETILANGWIEPEEKWKFQALGVCLGDTIVQNLSLDWVTVEDEFGQDPALNWPGTSVMCFPLTMISKRIERGDNVVVILLFEGVCADLVDMVRSGRYI